MSQAASRQGAPTPRRSTRISQSVASRSVVSVENGASGTPGKNKGNLPRLKARQSTAYGASGRVGHVEELELPATGFLQAFQVQRDAAMSRQGPGTSGAPTNKDDEEDDEEDDDEDAHSPTPVPNGVGAPSMQEYESDDDPSMDDDDEHQPEGPSTEDSSIANTSKSFGMMREAGMMRAPSPARPLPAAHRLRQPAPAPAITSHRPEPRSAPAQARVPLKSQSQARPQNGPRFVPPPRFSPHTPAIQPYVPIQTQPAQSTQAELPKIFGSWWRYLLYAVLTLVLAMIISRTETYQSGVDSLRERIHHATWAPPLRKPDPEFDYTYGWVRTRDNMFQKNLTDISTDLEDVHGTLSRLEEQLPPMVVVTKQPDGSVKVQDEFWRALEGKMKQEGFQGVSGIEWDAFLKNNEDKLATIFSRSFDVNKPHPFAISRKDVTTLLTDNWKQMSAHVEKKIAEVSKSIDKEIKKEVKRAVATEAKQAYIDQIRLQSLAMTNLVANMEPSMKKVNYFSQGLGATINTDMTSPTLVDNQAWLSRAARRVMVVPDRRPPAAALEKWDEAGECWCAPPDGQRDGKVQLGVDLSSHIFPDQITIEHIPMTAVPGRNIANAPKNVEVWVQSDEPAVPRYGSTDECQGDGPAGWICLGSVKYDIFGANHIQTFDLQAEAPASINRAIVRITNNWGADHTCMYRVRLHGAYDGPEYNYEAVE